MLAHKHKVDNNAEEILVQNTYNELSQLQNKKVGGTNPATPLQSIDYAYNIRGWMTKINDPNNLGSDLFGYKIKYNEREGLETPDALDGTLKVLPKFNVNIAEVDWRTGTNPNENLRRYGYVYDGLNRLKAGFYQNEVNPGANEFSEKMTYDLNGNIKSLKRSAGLSSTGVANTIDNLIYVYDNNNQSNRLSTVTDSSQNYNGYPDTSGNTITYDLNGNMKSHKDKNILEIRYNYLNLPNYIKSDQYVATGGRQAEIYLSTSNTYRADGTKLRKMYTYKDWIVSNFVARTETDYLDGFQYEKNFTFSYSGTPTLKFVPTSEGYFDFEKNKYIYNYTDHLGNTRLSYLHNGSSIEVLEENNYYPFGLKHEGYNGLAGNPSYKYKYNGKELQETGMYDYGARFYMPDIGRWGVVDNKAEKYNFMSPYNYAANNPVMFVDPDGNEIIFVHVIDDKTQVHLQYRKGNFYYLNGDLAGQKYDGRKQRVSVNLFRLARAYRKIERSNNAILKDRLHTLENSENKHYIFDPQSPDQPSGMNGIAGGGSESIYNLRSKSEKERFERMEGVPQSDLSLITHEMEHQYDKEKGNQSDATNDSNANNPSEQRAVKTENEARKLEGLPLRTTYGGQKVPANPQNYIMPTPRPKESKTKKVN